MRHPRIRVYKDWNGLSHWGTSTVYTWCGFDISHSKLEVRQPVEEHVTCIDCMYVRLNLLSYPAFTCDG